jgi:hypothetical protein
MKPGVWIALLISLAASPAPGQSASLEKTANQARDAWFGHEVSRLVRGSDSILVQLPGASPSVPVSRDQAAALLREFFRTSEEVQTDLGRVRKSGNDRALVEILRQYRVTGTMEVRRHSALLGYSLVQDSWRLVELRISP